MEKRKVKTSTYTIKYLKQIGWTEGDSALVAGTDLSLGGSEGSAALLSVGWEELAAGGSVFAASVTDVSLELPHFAVFAICRSAVGSAEVEVAVAGAVGVEAAEPEVAADLLP